MIDEADEMLERGFAEQMQAVFQHIGERAQVCLFSATLPHETHDIAKKFMREPIRINVKKEAITLEGIEQFYVRMEDHSWKFNTLCDLYGSLSVNQSIIFCNRKEGYGGVDWLAERLRAEDHTVAAMHGGMSQEERRTIMAQFRSGHARVLLTTDLIARGIDVQAVSHVINYDLPIQREKYIHRIGRGGRFGRKGVAISFVVDNGRSDDVQKIQQLEKYYCTTINELPAEFVDADK